MTTDPQRYLQHDETCLVDPGRQETTDYGGGILFARCLDCSSSFPPPDPHLVPGAESQTRDLGERYSQAVAVAERRLQRGDA